MRLLQAENLRKEYPSGDGPVVALRDASLAVDAGEFVGVVGPSGSGKSTLLSILGGLNPPTAGRVVDGIDIYRLHPEKRADFRGLPRRQQREMAAEALARVGLADKRHRLPGQLSGGEQQRVAIARAVANRPPLLLADEPTGALDSRTGQEIVELFATLRADGHSIVMVPHNQENLRYVDRVLSLRDGVIQPGPAAPGGAGGWRT